MRKALVVGINKYVLENVKELSGSVNDAIEMENLLSLNEDKSKNFDVVSLINEEATNININTNIKDLFINDDDISLFYFSGHGCKSGICCYDNMLNYDDIMDLVAKAKAKYKVIILDCCYSGQIATDFTFENKTILYKDTIILTACSPTEFAKENKSIKQGTFTNLLIGALKGGAADVIGNITAGSIYAYIDQALSAWEQRPYFKANVSSFVSIRNVKAKICVKDLKEALSNFDSADFEYELNPSYEETNTKKNRLHKHIKPYANEKNVKIMKQLQKLNRNGLVVPVGEEFMYFAAMNSKKVKLTPLGKHYWNLCKERKI